MPGAAVLLTLALIQLQSGKTEECRDGAMRSHARSRRTASAHGWQTNALRDARRTPSVSAAACGVAANGRVPHAAPRRRREQRTLPNTGRSRQPNEGARGDWDAVRTKATPARSQRAYRASVLDRTATRPDGDTEKDRETVRSMETWLACRQRRLGVVGLVCLLVITSLVTPLSLDMYTPAIPHMTDYFDADAGTVNLTLVDYYLFFAVGLLLFAGERPAGTQAGAHRRRGRLCGCQRAVRHGVRHLDARGHARPAGPGRRCLERRVHGRGEGRHRRGQA